MAEKTNIKGSGELTEVEVDVFVHNKSLPEKSIKVGSGTKLSDLLEKIARRYGLDITKMFISLNDRVIEIDRNGNLKENPTINENSTLQLLNRVIGGKK